MIPGFKERLVEEMDIFAENYPEFKEIKPFKSLIKI
jgi:hypothetical protein